ncbi:MAG: pimeloyl-CoA dehydrogenase large subunit [Alphaproteobacteria bacterium]|nr:pimeloyl-CoA dehydrogenase large subunit [Alphaproteobacteria bacterium]MBT4082720.1 pimeloyl-CoA dehydrogenase large subunit [Alphaproteobacteria bacterium]MBT4543949.1 pimeloyl-CoA dehydrogenase large subunit [Alphaproteobacteria bacterium]MBT7745136.1 pimeloyl-CoA dehydrogenase large subunit [Alphaproteobacteria bacterium]
MDLSFSAEDLEFQHEVRTFLVENLPADVKDRSDRGLHITREHMILWQKKLAAKGWIAPNWPEEHGGPGWSLTKKFIYNSEYALSGAPGVSPFGVSMVGPVIYTFGSDEQKAKYLPDILNTDALWCQGYSEPGSGSDLASLKTRAVRDGDDYVINGQKIWTSWAHLADMMFCLVRTNTEVKNQEGISFVLIPMDSPGITVRPIIGIDLEHSLNEVFFDDVRVPIANRVGEEDKGWTYAKFLLGNERNLVARVARSKYQLTRLIEIAGKEVAYGGRLLDDPDFKRKIAKLEVDLMALEYSELRYLSQDMAGRKLTAEPSMLKIKGAEIAQTLKGLLVEALGVYGTPYETDEETGARNDGPIGPDHAHGNQADNLYQRAATIYGGSNEVQRNIVAKMMLGL